MPLGTTTLSWLTLVALALSAVAVGLAIKGWRSAATPSRSPGDPNRPILGSAAIDDEIEALKVSVHSSLRHLAVVRYDAFADMGGHLSWSMALLDDGGDGVVLTSIHGRSEARTYAKNVAAWSANQQLSPEEQEAIGYARASDA